jgi:hypothetical protein
MAGTAYQGAKTCPPVLPIYVQKSIVNCQIYHLCIWQKYDSAFVGKNENMYILIDLQKKKNFLLSDTRVHL